MTIETLWIYTLACLLLVAAPGPDNLLAIARGLSQGKVAACVSAFSSGCGILVHVLAATAGLTALLVASSIAFTAVKLLGAAYLIWLGIKAIKSRSLISFNRTKPVPMKTVFLTGFLSASLNPKVGIFILAFIPQFISLDSGNIAGEMLLLGSWFALLTTVSFALMGMSSSILVKWLQARPRVVSGLNIGAGIAFIVSGLSVALAKRGPSSA
ncbi:MAG: LysE family translocator [Gammaproteobacteria bacterium]|nr:LysE family translocator [Gammaproteobacteria bacterium]